MLRVQGKEILEFFIEELIKSGTTYVPPFQEERKQSALSRSPADSAIDVSKAQDGEDTDASVESERFRTAREPREQQQPESAASAVLPTANGDAGKPETESARRRRSSTAGIQHQNSASTSGVRSTSFDDCECSAMSACAIVV